MSALIKFKLAEAFTLSEENMFGSFFINIIIDGKTESKIERLVKERNAINPIFDFGDDNKILRLKVNSLHENQKSELLNIGGEIFKIDFETKCLVTTNDVNYIYFKATEPHISDMVPLIPSEYDYDSCPEDF